MNDRYEKIKNLIEMNRDIADFADFGDGISEEWIKKAEFALGIALSPSYIWWLKNYGGGEIGGEEIFSIYGMDFETVVGGDIVYIYRLDQKNKRFPANQISICESDIDGTFYFNTDEKDENGEMTIYSAATGQLYAKNFLEFIEKRIHLFLEG